VADGARLYPTALGLTRWDRHALFLGRRWVVLRDVVRARGVHDFHWLIHFLNGATQEGSWVRGVADGGQELGVAVVSPPSFGLTVTQQAPRNVGGLNPAGFVYAAEVAPPVPGPAATFLTALVPTTTASWASRPSVVPLDPDRPEVGLVLAAGTRIASAIFSDDPGGAASGSGLDLGGLAGVAEWEGGALARVLLVEARSLSRSGTLLVSQDGTASMLEAEGLADVELRLSGDVLGKATVYAPAATRVTWYGQDVPFTRTGDYVQVNGGSTPAPPPPTSPPAPPPTARPSPALRAGCSIGAGADLLALLAAAAFWRLRRR
jgi:hypothetical protein